MPFISGRKHYAKFSPSYIEMGTLYSLFIVRKDECFVDVEPIADGALGVFHG